MRGKSHHCLGEFLANRYLKHVSKLHIQAFLLGCVEPDRNPTTYFKGSIRHQWMRGHNYPNAKRFIQKLSYRLEKKKSFTIMDFYILGKLIHYTADAFTLAHNDFFPQSLTHHREYEIRLQAYFLTFLKSDPNVNVLPAESIIAAICSYHSEYSRQEPHIHTDADYILSACCCIFSILFVNRSGVLP